MEIKRFKDFNDSINENNKSRPELFGNVGRRPSYVLSRQDQDFYDYYTRSKFRGLSKYDLNNELFKFAQREDEIGIIAQFCLQLQRESISADDYIIKMLEEIPNLEISDQIDYKKDKNGIKE